MIFESTSSKSDDGKINSDLPPDIALASLDSHDNASATTTDNLSRQVYCILGMPLDSFDMEGALETANAATLQDKPYLLSTPNLNFLINTLRNRNFRESVLLSDMSIADGMPLIWIARLLGLPIRTRVAGSELFEKMVQQSSAERPIKVFLFGGADGVAEKAGSAINARSNGVQCVGTLNPGFGTIEDISSDTIIERVNASGADFLVVALGAQKGQEWLLRNHNRLKIPLRAHLGASMNFQAGTVARAPRLFQKFGLEWLWRIKEEPQLWRRYRHDGLALISLMVKRVLPLTIKHHILDRLRSKKAQPLKITVKEELSSRTLMIKGDAIEANIENAIAQFRSVLDENCASLTIDLSQVKSLDQRFLGLLIMARKQAVQKGISFRIKTESRIVKRAFKMNEADYLLTDNIQHDDMHDRYRAMAAAQNA